jgi:hypothetical protein
MDKLMQAVNELKGDLRNSKKWNLAEQYSSSSILSHSSEFDFYAISSVRLNDKLTNICTVEEFNNLVSHLENWQPTPSVSPLANVTYAEYKEKFMSESKPKLETFNGMQHEIGKWYEFSNDGDRWDVSKLDAIEGSNFAFRTSLGWMQCCREAAISLGTITPAPVELVDGAAYEFNYNNGSTGMQAAIMRYRKNGDYFFFDNTTFEREHCTNITRLVPEVKS